MQKNIYEYINISNVINQLNLKKTNQIGNNIYLICPFCQCDKEKNGYMKANIIKNLFICNKCEESGTSVDLYAKMKYITTKEAYKQLLKETPILDNIPYVFNNPIKDDNYRDLVYKNFLNLQKLTDEHRNMLKNLTFTDEYIINNHFKSIETNEKQKKKICEQLQKMGLKLDGIPGFCATRF